MKNVKTPARRVRHRHIALACAGALALGCVTIPVATPTPAYAETSAELQAKLDDAKSKLNDLFLASQNATEQYETAQADLDQLKSEIDQTQADIETKSEQLKKSQSILSKRVAQDYKTGGISLTQIVLGSQDIGDFVERLMYASKINESDAQTISEVKELKTELDTKKAQLEQKKDEKVQKVAEAKSTKAKADSAAADMQNYVDSLDSQVQDALKQEQEAAAAEAAARAAAYQQQNTAAANAAQQAQSNSGQQGSGNASSSNGGSQSSSASSSSSSSSNKGNSGTSTSTSNGGLTDAQRATILAAARSCIGTPYSYTGQMIPGVAIDCSGVTSYAYACAGLHLPRTSAQQRAASKIKPISQCKPGDLVFWYGHVAIYAGNGRIVHANYSGVEETNLYGSYLGGGNPFDK